MMILRWNTADEANSGLLNLDEFTKAYQYRNLIAYRWKPDSLRFKVTYTIHMHVHIYIYIPICSSITFFLKKFLTLTQYISFFFSFFFFFFCVCQKQYKKISFKRTEPAPEVEEKWFQLNQYHGFDYTFVSPWPESQTHGLFLETLMTSLKQGGLDVFTYRTSTHGVGINRDARVVIKVRVPMKRLEAYASSTGYRFLLSKVLHLTI
jgi:hypothetical protein